jgi:hypothetical protein
MFATLDSYQDQMWTFALEREAALHRADSPDIDEIDRGRRAFAQVMAVYQRVVQREVYEPLLRTGAPDHVGRARAMKTECILIGEEVRAFVAQWPLAAIETDWLDYRVAGLALVDSIRAHVMQMRAIAADAAAQYETAPVTPVAARYASA